MSIKGILVEQVGFTGRGWGFSVGSAYSFDDSCYFLKDIADVECRWMRPDDWASSDVVGNKLYTCRSVIDEIIHIHLWDDRTEMGEPFSHRMLRD